MALTSDGPPACGSFMTSWKDALPVSPTIVGAPLTVLMTSEDSDEPPTPWPPAFAVRLVMTRYAGDWPVRIASLHAELSSVSITAAARQMRVPHTTLLRSFDI